VPHFVEVFHRLEQIVIRALAQCADGRFGGGMAGENDDDDIQAWALAACSTPRPSSRGI
jgi:hypothetical protein